MLDGEGERMLLGVPGTAEPPGEEGLPLRPEAGPEAVCAAAAAATMGALGMATSGEESRKGTCKDGRVNAQIARDKWLSGWASVFCGLENSLCHS